MLSTFQINQRNQKVNSVDQTPKRFLFEEIGFFDEDFFAYGDDSEIGIRARLAGWKCLYVPKAVLYHKDSGSTGHYSPFKAFYVERNRFWITLKYFPLPLLFLSFFLPSIALLCRLTEPSLTEGLPENLQRIILL